VTDEPLDITVIPFEFPSPAMALKALADLDRWSDKGDRDLSAYRLQAEDGVGRIVVVVVATVTGHVEPVIRRLRRGGGTFREIPEADKEVLVKRHVDAAMQGLDARRSYEVPLPLSGLEADPDMN
jgi:hypothetical protein